MMSETGNIPCGTAFPLPQGIHIVAKPAGPACNLNCAYCFYLEKSALYADRRDYRMSDEVLGTFIRSYIETQPTPEVEFVWQGGEPTLLGCDFFKRIIELQQPYSGTKIISNVLQTNGTLLDAEWCRFLKHNDFLVGLSLDGPEDIHDRYRLNRRGRGSFAKAFNGLQLLKHHGVQFNVMASVARETALEPLKVYDFFKEQGVEFIQFAPVVERVAGPDEGRFGLQLAGPKKTKHGDFSSQVTPWSVVPEEYGDFLIAIYEEWVRHDVGKTFVMNFEWALNAWVGNPSPVCVHARQCGQSLVIEHNGDVYGCDHYVYPQFQVGNILNDSLAGMVDVARGLGIGVGKEANLTGLCKECEVLRACQGGCPKHRFGVSPGGSLGQNYLCSGYRKFFVHIRKYLRVMGTLLENGYPAEVVMEAVKGPMLIETMPTEHINREGE
ncbi:anaerobic sulfatase maturase [Desulfopila aestuarii]|uniref:Radical SAM core domain-containing protein n=1 Tax=Desulfopila aestuarii DSM 18488 TaxID=1121416 RepID=A0A1M7YKZ6_9BACT|nr:anaerobic sulfatase maturase [Desulfopila aestuarii]SHO53283.1 uncharacterized protein SAMN02745220_05040 [Desulfopila aestuarii DSM 18488]